VIEVGIAYDLRSDFVDGQSPSAGAPDDLLEEYDSPETVEAIAAALEACGYRARLLGGGRALLRELLERPPALVFNLAEGAGTRSREAHVPAVCELLGVPYTHSDPLTLAITLDKSVANPLVSAAGVPTPRGQVVERPDAAIALDFPVIAKPVAGGSSLGLRTSSRADSADELRPHLERLLRDYRQPALVEEFCPGPEFTVGIVGAGDAAEVIGVMELVPRAIPVERFVYSVELKRAGPAEVDYLCPPRRPESLRAKVVETALAAYRVLGCRDIARVDVRLAADGEPRFLEVNPLPGLQPWWGDLVLLAEARGFGYAELIGTIVARARERQGL
jgi:D-alanine-D-alanine ligase